MKRNWELEDLIEYFTIMPNEMSLIGNKSGETRLDFAVLLKFFQYEARFPNFKNEIPKIVVQYISKQVQVTENLFESYNMNSRTYYNHKSQIRDYLGFREPTVEDASIVTEWLLKHVFYNDVDFETLKYKTYNRFKELHIEPPTPERIDRLIKSAIYTYENQFFEDTFQKLSKDSIAKMDTLINDLASYDAEDIPIDGVIKPGMKDAVIEKDDKGQERINRINYEIVTLQSLRDKLRYKEIWVVGADRYRNPDQDLLTDFEERREENYRALKQPLNSDEFINSIKKAMYDGLTKLDNGMPKNSKVSLSTKNNGWITLSPSEPQAEPVNLSKIKAEIMRHWPMTSLLDVLKEADLRINFTE